MTLNGCKSITQINYCPSLPYPNLSDEQFEEVHKIDPRMSTWARDFKIEFKENCE